MESCRILFVFLQGFKNLVGMSNRNNSIKSFLYLRNLTFGDMLNLKTSLLLKIKRSN